MKTYVIYDNISPSSLTMRAVSDKSCRKNQNKRFMLSNLLPENRALREVMWNNKVEATSHRRKYNTAHVHCMLDN
jgi:hypothetical protein